MKNLFILSLLILSGLSTISYAKDYQIPVEVTVKNASEKSCYLHLYDGSLVVAQRPNIEGYKDELVVEFNYHRLGSSSTELSPELGHIVTAEFQKTLTVSQGNKTGVSLEKVIASEDLTNILDKLLENTPYSNGATYSGVINTSKIAEALRAKCK